MQCDIQGPKIRLGNCPAEGIHLNIGDTIRVCPDPELMGSRDRISILLPTILQDLTVGDKIFINDGIVELVVMAKEPADLVCQVRASGFISARKGCNIPSTKVSVDIVTEKDRGDLKAIASLNPEFVAASFVGSASDVAAIRAILHENGAKNVQIVSKIERPLALLNIDEIIRASDAVMVARGDLGVEIPAHQVPLAQKEIVDRCNRHARPVIIATQV